jgi:hypothetical protein
MVQHKPKTAFIATKPSTSIVFEFPTTHEADAFHEDVKLGHISERNMHWVCLPLPHNLDRVYTAENGEIALEFEHHSDADKWNEQIQEVGRFYPNPHKEARKRTVYVGQRLVDLVLN